jgi:hypothetical protein
MKDGIHVYELSTKCFSVIFGFLCSSTSVSSPFLDAIELAVPMNFGWDVLGWDERRQVYLMSSKIFFKSIFGLIRCGVNHFDFREFRQF